MGWVAAPSTRAGCHAACRDHPAGSGSGSGRGAQPSAPLAGLHILIFCHQLHIGRPSAAAAAASTAFRRAAAILLASCARGHQRERLAVGASGAASAAGLHLLELLKALHVFIVAQAQDVWALVRLRALAPAPRRRGGRAVTRAVRRRAPLPATSGRRAGRVGWRAAGSWQGTQQGGRRPAGAADAPHAPKSAHAAPGRRAPEAALALPRPRRRAAAVVGGRAPGPRRAPAALKPGRRPVPAGGSGSSGGRCEAQGPAALSQSARAALTGAGTLRPKPPSCPTTYHPHQAHRK